MGAAVLGVLAGVLARIWLRTLRVHVTVHPALAASAERPWVYAFWHGTQWPLLAWKRRRSTVVMVSLSRDGAIQARALRLQGMTVVRGSSTRDGARGLGRLIRAMRRGADAAFAVDGPRGPRGRVKQGAIAAARSTHGVVVPMTGVVHRGVVFRRTWDRFELAWPFSRVDVLLGAPVDPATVPDARAEVERSLEELDARGRALSSRRRTASRRTEGDGVDLDGPALR